MIQLTTNHDLLGLRLHNQYLSGGKFEKPLEVVRHMGAVQSQDFPAAKWSLGLRIQNATNTIIEESFNEGTILRTHIMRPTWHFVLPEDIVWLQKLTAPRVKTLLAHYDRKLEITPQLIQKSNKLITDSLKGKTYLTRTELADILEKNKIPARGQRLGHIVIHAELDALICSGPRRGKQFTYALLEERVPSPRKLDREQSLTELAHRYFTSHGPAQLRDFTWWSGLSVKDAALGLESVKKKLIKETVDGKTYWFSPEGSSLKEVSPKAFLLSIYDEYTIAYKDRSALAEQNLIEKFIAMGNALTAVVIFDGRVIGTWKRVTKAGSVIVSIRPLKVLTRKAKEEIHYAAQRYGQYLSLTVELVYEDPR